MNLKPLEGITIVEMGTSEAEGIAALLLSDYGAKVIRLEFPDNEKDIHQSDKSFRICDRGKIRLLFRPDMPEDRKWLKDLLPKIDGIVTSVPDLQMSQWNLTVDILCSQNPRLVYTCVTGFGQKGPYAQRHGYDDGVIQAESGFMSVTGPEGGEPVRSGSDFAAFAGGANACIATLMALIDAARTGQGRKIDISMMDSLLYGLENQYSVYLKSRKIPRRIGNHYALSAPVGDYPCRDGRKLMISVATQAQWENFANVLGHPEWLDNPDYRDLNGRLKHYVRLGEDVTAAFMEHDCDELMELLQTKSCIYGKINNFEDVVNHPQAKERQMFMEISVPDGTKMTVPSNPLMIDGHKFAGTKISDTKLCQECDMNQMFDTKS